MADAARPTLEVGAYEAKTRLPELLREVQAGRSYVITVRGKPVAELVPARAGRPDAQAAIARILALQKPAGTVTRAQVEAWKSEGRR